MRHLSPIRLRFTELSSGLPARTIPVPLYRSSCELRNEDREPFPFDQTKESDFRFYDFISKGGPYTYCGRCRTFSDPTSVSKIASTCRWYSTIRDKISRNSGSRSASLCHFASTAAGTSISRLN